MIRGTGASVVQLILHGPVVGRIRHSAWPDIVSNRSTATGPRGSPSRTASLKTTQGAMAVYVHPMFVPKPGYNHLAGNIIVSLLHTPQTDDDGTGKMTVAGFRHKRRVHIHGHGPCVVLWDPVLLCDLCHKRHVDTDLYWNNGSLSRRHLKRAVARDTCSFLRSGAWS